MFTYKVTKNTAAKLLNTIDGRLASPGPLLKKFGMVMLRSVAKNFKSGGRPTPWKASAWAKAGGKTLIDSGRLKNSISQSFSKSTLRIFTRVIYARIHQLGGVIKKNATIQQHWRYMDKAFGKNIPARSVLVRTHSRQMNTKMPKRPFILVQDADMRVMTKMSAEWGSGA